MIPWASRSSPTEPISKGFSGWPLNPQIAGFTTNPTLMRKAGVEDYEGFARKVLDHITDRPISFEVFSDDFAEMRRQALLIGGWGPNVYVKIPVTNTRGESSAELVHELSADGLRLNVTALLSLRPGADRRRSTRARLRGQSSRCSPAGWRTQGTIRCH